MKKILGLAVVFAFLLSSCIMISTPIDGTLVTDATVPGSIHEPLVEGEMVEGRAMASGILGIVTGDCSYETALKDALSKTKARKLKNIVVDYQVKNILHIYAEYTTIVRGVPVK